VLSIKEVLDERGDRRPVLSWKMPPGSRAVSTAVVGGGIGPCDWVVNIEVHNEYHRDPVEHVAQVVSELGLRGRGSGLLTAASVRRHVTAEDHGVLCAATVGLSHPVFAAAPGGTPPTVGTINTICWVPAPLDDAALVNMVVTATEAKAQALAEAGTPGTGTPSDAIVICCPSGGGEQYGGPRSSWGAKLARAVHAATLEGARDWYALVQRLDELEIASPQEAALFPHKSPEITNVTRSLVRHESLWGVQRGTGEVR